MGGLTGAGFRGAGNFASIASLLGAKGIKFMPNPEDSDGDDEDSTQTNESESGKQISASVSL